MENWSAIFFKSFLVYYQIMVMICSLPPNLSYGDFESGTRPEEDIEQDKISYPCHELYYKTVSAKDSKQSLSVCGQSSTPIDQDQGTLGVSKAKLGNFPWQALTFNYGRGGGALLGDRWILTAAHTIYPKDSFFQKNKNVNVFLGHTDIEEIIKLGSHSVRRVIVHPDYHQEESNNFEGDIALLELENSVPLSPNVLPICLPDNETLYGSGLMGFVSGFGMEQGLLVNQLKYVHLPIAKREACETWLLEKNRTEVFSSNMFCAGDSTLKQDACQGDSGGVFAVWDNTTERWVATGIVSWGIDCHKGYGFYTKVLNYVGWLKGIMEGVA
ncbi:complement C1r subcomponent-like protein isoform X2 [Macrotis lagotis]|uniref:complement C1r subcomponent-like protein isoform X2 n=1 Tax=Macrotis lagotis TaxID=92651 RepID=UPI003D68D6DD